MADPAALRQQLQTAEAEWHAERLNLEQLLHQCERERSELVASQAQSQKELTTSRLESEQSQAESERLAQALAHANERLVRLQTSKDELAADLESERARSAQLIGRTAEVEAEVDRLRDDCARYSERQIELTKQLNATERALAMEKALIKPVKIQLGDAEQRQRLLQSQNEMLQSELDARSEELLQQRRELGAQLGELSTAKELNGAQCKDWEARYQASAEEISALKSKLTDALNRLQEERNASVSAACQYQSELDAEKRLSTTLKRSLAEANESVAELENVIVALRTDYKASTDRARDLERAQKSAEVALLTAEENVENMRHELQAVQEQNRPPLTLASPTEVSLKGIKIEDLYGRLVQTNQLLMEERAKSRKLQLYLEQIEEEIREQSPLLKERQADIQNLVKVNNTLATRVKDCNYQRDLIERKLQEAVQRAESEYNQRQQLIQFIRAQGVEGFEEGTDMQVAVVSQADNDVNSWRRLVEQLEEELKKRDLQLARLENEIRSRNMLVASSSAIGQGPAPTLAMMPASPPRENGDQRLIVELRQQVEMLQSEKSASERQLQTSVDDARRQCHEVTIKLAMTEGNIAMLSQKLEWMTSQATRFSAENDKLRAHDAQRDAMLIVTQEKISTLTADFADSNQRYIRSSTQLQQVRAQLELARQTEDRLTEQCGDMAVLRQHNEQLLTAMHSVHQKLETGQSANVQQLTAEKDRIYQDMLQVQKQAAIERRSLQQNIKILEERCQSLQTELEIAHKATDEANSELAQLSAAANSAQSAHAKLLEELRAVKHEREMLAKHAQTGDESGGRQLMMELAHAQAEAQSFQEKVAALTAESTEWKTLCEQRAQLLDELEESLRAQRQRTASDVETLRSRVEELTEQCRNCDQQYEDALVQLEKKDSMSVSQARELQARVEDAERRLAQAEEKSLLFEEISDSKVQEAAEYRRRYEAELTGHAAAVTALNEARQELASLQQQLKASRQTELDAVDALSAVQEQSLREVASLSDHLKQARETIASLSKKNDLLLAQLETGHVGKSTDAGEDDEEANRTRQIITFLRSEKEIAEAEVETASRQIVRLESEVEQLRSNLEQARNEISSLQERESSMQIVTDTRPSEDTSVLLESNQMLRNQKMEVMKQLKELEERLALVQESSGPMQSQIAELNSTVLSLQAEKSALEADVERWKSRNQQILSRYNQVDPELYRQAKESLAEAKLEIESRQSKLQSKDTQIVELQDKLARANQGQANVETIRRSAVFNLQQVNALKRELASRPDPAQFGAQLSEAQKCIKTLRALCSRLRAVLERRNESVSNLQGQVDSQKSDISTLNQKAADLQDRLNDCEQSLQITEERRATEITSSQEQLTALQQQLAEANDRCLAATSEPSSSTPPAERSEDAIAVHHKRPSSPNIQPAQKKMKPQEPEEPSPVAELEMQPLQPEQQLEQPEKQQHSEKTQEESGAVPIRRLRRNRAASTSLEPAAPIVSEHVNVANVEDEEDVEGGGVVEEEGAAAADGSAPGPVSDAEEGEVMDDSSDPNHHAMDI